MHYPWQQQVWDLFTAPSAFFSRIKKEHDIRSALVKVAMLDLFLMLILVLGVLLFTTISPFTLAIGTAVVIISIFVTLLWVLGYSVLIELAIRMLTNKQGFVQTCVVTGYSIFASLFYQLLLIPFAIMLFRGIDVFSGTYHSELAVSGFIGIILVSLAATLHMAALQIIGLKNFHNLREEQAKLALFFSFALMMLSLVVLTILVTIVLLVIITSP